MDWFRFYTKTLDSAKVQELPDRLFKAWVNFMCVARIFDGVLPNHREIAFRLRCSPEQALRFTHELKDKRLIDDIPGTGFVMHDWDEYQFRSDDAAARKRHWRTGHRAASARDIHRTSLVLEQNRAETEQNRDRTERNGSLRAAEFASAFPDQSDQNRTAQEYISLVTPPEEDLVFACLERYKASAQVADGVIQAGWTWLQHQKQNGWKGQWVIPIPRKRAKSIDELVEEMNAEERAAK